MWFLEEYKKLQKESPRLALTCVNSENSDFTNYCSFNRNCYFCFGIHYSEDCYYLGYSVKNTDCTDCEDIERSELMYECILCEKCYNCTHGSYLIACSDCDFCWDMSNCTNCFLCTGMQNTSHCIANEKLTEEEYKKKKRELLDKYSIEKLLEELIKVRQKHPQRAVFQKNCENCIGPDLRHCKNVFYSSAAKNSEDCIYTLRHINNVKDGVDIECIAANPSEVIYNSIGCSGIQNVQNSCIVWFSSDIYHSEQIWNSRHCLLCVSRNHAEHEILNKKYPPEEYFKKFEEIKQEMLAAGVWNQINFPSTYKYEDTLAELYYSR
ncbi:MAG: hypothetical protein ABH856_04205 [Patescibacteria group bacterium]